MTRMRSLLCSMLCLSLVLVMLTGCESISRWTQSKEIILPSTTPLASETLAQVAGTCKKDVELLAAKEGYVPAERKKEFNVVLGLAEDNCTEMTETLERLKAATYQEQSFRQNLQHAQSTIVRGATTTPTTGSDIAEESFMDFGAVDKEPFEMEEVTFDMGPLK